MQRLKRLSQEVFLDVSNHYLFMSYPELTRFVTEMSNPTRAPAKGDPTVLEMMVAMNALKAIRDGDSARLEFFLTRHLGKVPDKINLGGHDGGPVKYDDADVKRREARIRELVRALGVLQRKALDASEDAE